jgi:hypothetical protein
VLLEKSYILKNYPQKSFKIQYEKNYPNLKKFVYFCYLALLFSQTISKARALILELQVIQMI